jgi:hypothetical protein
VEFELAKEDFVSAFTADYEIVPGFLYGWNFRCIGSRHIIKFSADYKALIEFAKSYCETHNSSLIVYNFLGEAVERISFER